MRILLRYDNLGIDEEDVRDCQDIEVLKQWKLDIDLSIESIRHRLDVEVFTNKHENSEWIIKAKTAKKRLGQLSQIIQNRISDLKRTYNKVVQSSKERRFYDAAYQYLSKKEFEKIKLLAESL